MWWTILIVAVLSFVVLVAAVRDYRVKCSMNEADRFINITTKKLNLYTEYTKHKNPNSEYIQDTLIELVNAYRTIPKLVDQLPRRHYREGCERIQKRAYALQYKIEKTIPIR